VIIWLEVIYFFPPNSRLKSVCVTLQRTRVWISYLLGFSQISTSCWHVLPILCITPNPDIQNIAASYCTCDRFLNQTFLLFPTCFVQQRYWYFRTNNMNILIVTNSLLPPSPEGCEETYITIPIHYWSAVCPDQRDVRHLPTVNWAFTIPLWFR
jgi:hypothetical protein